MRVSVLSSRLPVQTAPAPAAIGPGRAPTAIAAVTRFDFGSITATEFGGATSGASSWRNAATTATVATASPTSMAVRARRRPRRSGPRSCGLPGWSGKRGILVEHLPFECLQLGAGLDSEALDERLARGAVRGERIGLPPGPVEREHLLRSEALAVRVLHHERVELVDQVGVAAERQVRIDPIFERSQALLLELGRGSGTERRAVELGQRRAAPERERLVQRLGSSSRFGRVACLCTECRERLQVERARLELEYVPRRTRSQRCTVFPERLAQAGDVHLQRRARRLRRRVAPQLIDQSLARHDAVCLQQEQGEHRPLLARPQVEPDPAALCLERPEQPKAKFAHFRIQFGLLSAGIQHLRGCWCSPSDRR